MQDQDIAAPSSRQSRTAVIIVAVFAGVIVTRSSVPRITKADTLVSLQSEQNIEHPKLSTVNGQDLIMDVKEIQP